MIRPQFSREEFNRDLLKISDPNLLDRRSRVLPLWLNHDGRLCSFIAPSTVEAMRSEVFTPDPECREELDPEKHWYAEVCRTNAHFSCGYHAFFKPSLAEVYAQMPYTPIITAFYLDTKTVVALAEGNGHMCTVHWLTNTPVESKYLIELSKKQETETK